VIFVKVLRQPLGRAVCVATLDQPLFNELILGWVVSTHLVNRMLKSMNPRSRMLSTVNLCQALSLLMPTCHYFFTLAEYQL
jgi:hypothetical protein